MAIKIIENENGTVTEKTSKQITRERKLHKFQKAVSVAGFTAAMLAASSMSVFAANGENAAPSNVSTSTKNLEAGDYELRVNIEDNNGDEYSKTVNFTVEVPKITFSVDPGSKDFFTGGGSDKAVIEIKNVKGGTSDEYEYKFEYIKYGSLTDTMLTPPNDSSSWKKIKDFGGESSSDFTVKDDDQAGIYAVRVSVQNKGNTNNSLVYRQIILGYTVKIKIKHTLEDINMLVNKVDTWMSTAFYGDMFEQVKAWSPENEEYDNYPFSYDEFIKARQEAVNCNTNGNKDYDTVYSKLETEFTKLQNLVSSGCVSANPLSIAPYSKGFTDSVLFLFKSMVGGISELFKYAVGEGNSIFYSFDYNEVADFIFPLFKTFAYALIIIFAGVNALETALQYEMFTLKGGVKILGRLVLAKVWVDISLLVCRAIVSIAVGWMSQISILTTDIAEYIHIDIPISGSSGSPSFITGHIFDWLNMQILSINISLLILPLIIMLIIIYIKLFIRSFELAMLQCVSPVFFACLTGETTKQYFKKFIMTYISVAFEVVFMALIWYIYVEYLNQSFNHQIETLTVESMEELFSMESGVFNFFMVSVGAFILMIKPPQVLKNLVSA